MKKPERWRYSLLALCLLAQSASAELWDAERERSIAAKMNGTLEVGKVIWLELENGRTFPGIYAHGGPDYAETAVILMHGMGAHPDWPEVISPLRKSLTGMGWTTLSLQMPVLKTELPIADYGKTLLEAEKRIDSAVDFLKTSGFERLVLIGYGFGGATAAHYAAASRAQDIAAFAGISILARKYLEPPMDLNNYLAGIKLPVLDVYAEHDLSIIVASADDRRLIGYQNPRQAFSQVMIPAADHYYTGQETALMQSIDQWLQNLDPLRAIIVDNTPAQPAPAGD